MTLIATIALGISIPLVMAQLTNSTFESSDGNLVVNTAGNHDWNDPVDAITCPATAPGAGTNCGTDLTKSGDDDAFGKGAKEDIANPAEVTGSIPPMKSDLTRFYVNTDKENAKDFLYIAWQRSNVLGSANMDFEFNQDATLAAGKHTPLRTEGDLIVAFDFVNGGSTPVLGLLTWLTKAGPDKIELTADDGNADDCYATNALPCWGAEQPSDLLDTIDDERLNLSAAGFADGAVNAGSVTDDNDPDAPFALAAGTFGEAAINLTDANVFPQNVCSHFGSAFLKSRSSASFPAELKDFIAPIPVDISNCGGLAVQKYIDINENSQQELGERPTVAVPGDVANWSFTITGPQSFECTGTTDSSGVLSACYKSAGVLADLGALPSGTYTVQENLNTGKTIGTNASAFFNTDPGPIPTSPPVTKTATVAVDATTTTQFGNTCYSTANFEVQSVPTGQSGLFVRYTVDGGSPQEVNLARDGATANYKASVGSLRMGDVIAWSYGINRGTASEQTKTVPGSFTLGGYPGCSGSSSTNFVTTTINGSKFKDVNGNGVRNLSATPTLNDGPLQGFQFELRQGSSGSGSAVGTAQRSAGNGTFAFQNVAPGTYTVHEINRPSGWLQTQPASDGHVSVTVNLGDASVTADPFGNTPLSKVQVNFLPQAKLLNLDGSESATSATKATSIACTDPADPTADSVGSSTNSNTLMTGNVQIKQSSVTCVITYEDP